MFDDTCCIMVTAVVESVVLGSQRSDVVWLGSLVLEVQSESDLFEVLGFEQSTFISAVSSDKRFSSSQASPLARVVFSGISLS